MQNLSSRWKWDLYATYYQNSNGIEADCLADEAEGSRKHLLAAQSRVIARDSSLTQH